MKPQDKWIVRSVYKHEIQNATRQTELFFDWNWTSRTFCLTFSRNWTSRTFCLTFSQVFGDERLQSLTYFAHRKKTHALLKYFFHGATNLQDTEGPTAIPLTWLLVPQEALIQKSGSGMRPTFRFMQTQKVARNSQTFRVILFCRNYAKKNGWNNGQNNSQQWCQRQDSGNSFCSALQLIVKWVKIVAITAIKTNFGQQRMLRN